MELLNNKIFTNCNNFEAWWVNEGIRGLHAKGIPLGDTRRLDGVSRRGRDGYTDATDFHRFPRMKFEHDIHDGKTPTRRSGMFVENGSPRPNFPRSGIDIRSL